MVYHKLEKDIKEALKGKEYGRNKIVVETGNVGKLYIYDFDEESKNQQISDLEGQIEELEADNASLESERDELQERIEELEG